MNAAWGGMYDYNQITISLAPHVTTDNIIKSNAFTVSFATKDNVVESDYVGIVSLSDDPKKMEKAGLNHIKSKFVNAPLFDKYPLTLECELVSLIDGTLIGNIINVSADESILTNGKVDIKKLNPIIYNPINHTYMEIGEEIAFAFKIGKKIK
jgi:flavin reductase (DIM6/NTAB) family NADH-FMN oxidoreductase RutF